MRAEGHLTARVAEGETPVNAGSGQELDAEGNIAAVRLCETPPPMTDHRYPESIAGGYTRADGKVAFYQRVQAVLADRPGPQVIVEFGAGRGGGADTGIPIHRRLQELRGPDRTVIGLDVDPIVRTNPLVDEAHVIEPGGRLPLDDASVDLIVSEWTFEHVAEPEQVAHELRRILKPGGWICACTPNKWGYIALAARLIPNRMHVRALRRLQPDKAEQDTFPTRYLMNTRSDLDRLFPSTSFEMAAYTHDAEPYLYAGSSALLTSAIAVLHRLPRPFKSVWFVFARKR